MQLSQPFAVVTPTLDGPVLAALALADRAFTSGELVRLLSRGSEEGVRKVLQRLTSQGVVEADRIGPVFSYRLNRNHLAAEYIVGLANLRSRLFERIEERLATWLEPPVFAAIFGSAASGEMRVDSDIDLLLVRADASDEETWQSQVDELVQTVRGWTGNDVRPLEYTDTELEAAVDEPVLADVARSGITIAGERSWLSNRLRRRKG